MNMEQLEEFPKHILDTPKIKFLIPRIKPVPLSLNNENEVSSEETEEETNQEYVENSSTECNSEK